MRRIRSTTAAIAAAALLLAGCGADDVADTISSVTDAVDDGATEEIETTEPDAATADGDTSDVEAGSDDADVGSDDADAGDPATAEVVVEGRAIDATVFHSGLEYTVAELSVVDLDADTTDGSADRVQGLMLTFDVSVFNSRPDTVNPSVPVSLRWDEPGTGNVVDVTGRGEFRQVPGDSSSSGQILVQLGPDDLEVYDDASARLIVGRSGQSPAQVPVGSNAELIDRFPVPQPVQIEPFDVEGVLVTVTGIEVRWDELDRHVDDGTALLELTYTMDNQSDNQSCSSRNGGAWPLTLPNGDSIVELGVSERCVLGEQVVTDVLTGLLIGADYAGDYTLRHVRGDDVDEHTITLVDGPGVRAADRDSR